MLKRALLLVTLAAVYMAYKRNQKARATAATDLASDAQWANEGGAHAPASV